MAIYKMEINAEEKLIIERHRKIKEKERKKFFMQKSVIQIYQAWLIYEEKNGAELTFSTFTSESEFNVSQYLDKNLQGCRKKIYNFIFHSIPNLKRLSNELF